MSITSVIVLYAITWFMVFFVVLPLNLTTQGEEGQVVPGTHESSPAGPFMRRKLWITTIFGTIIWALLTGIILSGWITIDDIDWARRFREPG
ncbi:DUF1467 family protein [Pseudoroseicyclus tamaricis]|uniref:DUF1467 family protein n=1 Tax=Pseudoroseicyclus tamaricis TaxID=2705421 RepID=A0A6B2JKZ6_9RHOB|nr:DUF1467 family protein [Pseudoroseicyclus tamaricis]NDV02193.1 DUF1467 family protein [Pseudoroseicyclus tamaricis]